MLGKHVLWKRVTSKCFINSWFPFRKKYVTLRGSQDVLRESKRVLLMIIILWRQEHAFLVYITIFVDFIMCRLIRCLSTHYNSLNNVCRIWLSYIVNWWLWWLYSSLFFCMHTADSGGSRGPIWPWPPIQYGYRVFPFVKINVQYWETFQIFIH